jgi:hypothetical protein
MSPHFHFQLRDSKENMAEDIRAWVQRTVDTEAKLTSLERMTTFDLTILMLAAHKAEEGK